MAKTNKLSGVVRTAGAPAPRPTKQMMESERRYRAEDALRTLTRAEEYKRDRGLMKDVQCLVKEQIKSLGNISGNGKKK